jgi:hypothetical protein
VYCLPDCLSATSVTHCLKNTGIAVWCDSCLNSVRNHFQQKSSELTHQRFSCKSIIDWRDFLHYQKALHLWVPLTFWRKLRLTNYIIDNLRYNRDTVPKSWFSGSISPAISTHSDLASCQCTHSLTQAFKISIHGYPYERLLIACKAETGVETDFSFPSSVLMCCHIKSTVLIIFLSMSSGNILVVWN